MKTLMVAFLSVVVSGVFLWQHLALSSRIRRVESDKDMLAARYHSIEARLNQLEENSRLRVIPARQ